MGAGAVDAEVGVGEDFEAGLGDGAVAEAAEAGLGLHFFHGEAPEKDRSPWGYSMQMAGRGGVRG